MAGPFSGHLIDSFNLSQFRSSGPFGQPMASPSISVHGAMSFDPNMHGANPGQSFDLSHIEGYHAELSKETAVKIATLQAKLNQKLGPEFLSQRPGPGGGPKLTYAEGWKIINLANEVFGFNGWSTSIVNLTTDFIDQHPETKRFNIGVTAIIRVTLRDGVFHEDIGYGMLENTKSKGQGLDKCKKEAVTDGLKRALRSFGNLLGNCLYDKAYIQEVTKIKVPAPKFEKSHLYRRPEFQEDVKPTMSTATAPPIASSSSSGTRSESNRPVQPKAEPNPTPPAPIQRAQPLQQAKAPSNLPAHMQRNVPQATSTPVNNSRTRAAPPGGLNTPQYTPAPALAPLPVATNSEDSFHFSDDDAFLATIDLGEGDLGRPILYEDELHDELTSADTSNVGGEHRRQPVIAPAVQPKHPQMPQAGQGSNGRPRSTHKPGYLASIIEAEQRRQQEEGQQQQSSSKGEAGLSNLPPNNTATVDQSSSNSSRAGSAGGFHFPPGMTPLTDQSRRVQPPVGNVMKRPAEVAFNPRKPAQGLGLSNSRLPLGQLDLGEGGEVKRMKR